jgi:hypothetical protein
MSLLMADHESWGDDDGDSGAGEKDSVMRMNLAEGCWAVNGERLETRPTRQTE